MTGCTRQPPKKSLTTTPPPPYTAIVRRNLIFSGLISSLAIEDPLGANSILIEMHCLGQEYKRNGPAVLHRGAIFIW